MTHSPTIAAHATVAASGLFALVMQSRMQGVEAEMYSASIEFSTTEMAEAVRWEVIELVDEADELHMEDTRPQYMDVSVMTIGTVLTVSARRKVGV